MVSSAVNAPLTVEAPVCNTVNLSSFSLALPKSSIDVTQKLLSRVTL